MNEGTVNKGECRAMAGHVIRRDRLLLCSIVATVAFAGCGGTTTPAAPTRASVTVTVTPNPITARRCNPLCVAPSGKSFPFEAAMTVAVQESARLGGDVDFINVSPVTADGIELPRLNYGSDAITQRATTNHFAASGALNFSFAFFYSTGVNNPALTVNIAWQVTDEKGNQITGTTTVSVTDPSPPSSDSRSSLQAPAQIESQK